MRNCFAALLLLAACEQKRPAPQAEPAVPVVVDAAPPADLYYTCRTTLGDTQVATADVLPHPAHGTERATVTITSKGTTRKLLTTVTPHAATVILMFEAYAPGDQKPADEKLVPGKTMILRLVGMGDDTDLYPEAPIFGSVPSSSRCAR